MRIIPAIDVIEGKAVRLEKGDFEKKKVYADDPLEMAKAFEGAGLKHLHLVDLDGAKKGSVQHQGILEKIKSNTGLIVDYGGGIRNESDIKSLVNAGADQINIGSLSIKDRPLVEQFIVDFGKEFIILSPDVNDRKIAIHGWQEASDIDLFDYINDYMAKGVSYFVCTDIAKDGMLEGSSIELYEEIMSNTPDIKLVASGGVTDIGELETLKALGIDGVIIGKAIYEGRISLNELTKYVI
ncbi:1-(5-phosphoribosyl)-5-[(5-phosphoribosylamino)methylideneamino]imidazole-4-carboxamide isomerase [Portibacter lacus]|uniref:1-(5-phosphoribosyl)-5-[(5-phosphoribosylamino)methylideneamino] imidazole-4-carboxamide isomerase n=1 Tax=Portibacter lacus TaxID=1099794 RepID=A0AA37SM33_9BACT|nr:1-(5-phosphoribosyl)-5-[(5-phosphoribosylamino)methylideneamino]imidazole-4-carboxamide isomerase [Portibacter lacus]GLR16315.1 1-(5-phosphoribosyl)-5-[(5-phosphoribosylamino) methylideneamino] imidazole-4-carboxamide isomerase [Portibacter lacus]